MKRYLAKLCTVFFITWMQGVMLIAFARGAWRGHWATVRAVWSAR